MLRTHKIELDLNNKQKTIMLKHAGYSRLAYNHSLYVFKLGLKLNKWYSWIDLNNKFNKEKYFLYPWCKELSQYVAKNSIKHLGNAFQSWRGKTKTGKRKSKNSFPKFKKKRINDSFQINSGKNIKTNGKYVKLPKIGWIKMFQELRFNGDIIMCTISRTANKWFACFVVDTKTPIPNKKLDKIIGVDVGIKTLATCSDGRVFENPNALIKNIRKLKRLQRNYSKKKNTSNRKNKLKLRIQKLHYKISCIRKDNLHKASTTITKSGGIIKCEDLNIKGMLKNRKLSRALSDSSLSEFINMLEYKSELYGCKFEKVNRWFPSSKLCSNCGEKNNSLTLGMRKWKCKHCNMILERDLNAAINIKNAGKSSVSGRGDTQKTFSEAAVYEALTCQPAYVSVGARD